MPVTVIKGFFLGFPYQKCMKILVVTGILGGGLDLRDNCLKNSLPVSEKKKAKKTTVYYLVEGHPKNLRSHQGFATDLFSAGMSLSLKTNLPYNTAIYNSHPKLVAGFSPTHLKHIFDMFVKNWMYFTIVSGWKKTCLSCHHLEKRVLLAVWVPHFLSILLPWTLPSSLAKQRQSTVKVSKYYRHPNLWWVHKESHHDME